MAGDDDDDAEAEAAAADDEAADLITTDLKGKNEPKP